MITLTYEQVQDLAFHARSLRDIGQREKIAYKRAAMVEAANAIEKIINSLDDESPSVDD